VTYQGTYNGTTYWRLQGGSWYIFWDGTDDWVISDSLGGSIYWELFATIYDPTGIYASVGGEGNPTVS